ncbi:MAG TPA: type III glutamate--ammonia ligase [Reyranella sp.]
MPLAGLATVGEVQPLSDGTLLYSIETYLRPPYFSRYDETTARAVDSKLAEISPVSFADTEVLREFAASKDATSIPLNIIRRKGTKLTGTDAWMGGQPVDHAPRNVLKRLIAMSAEQGREMMTGVECEFFLISADGAEISDAADRQGKPCYDQQALMRRYDVIAEICDAMQALGWQPYQNDHEDANGQFEMNWRYDTALTTADRHSFFKYMVRSIAEKHGLRATFMPKPFLELTGNGCHAHVSLWQNGRNLFDDPSGELGVSALGYQFLGGLLHSAEALAALFNPTVNSYKRINAPPTLSGASWAPGSVTWSGNNRTHMIRIPEPGRFELRLADGAANPYLLQAGILAAGLDGIDNKRDPGQRLDINMYTHGHTVASARMLPLNLLDALRRLEGSDVLAKRLGGLVPSYLKLKREEWNAYARHLSPWERETTLDV